MEKLRRPVANERLSLYDRDQDLIPVACREYFLMSRGDISYYLIDLREVDWDRLWGIISECEYVESSCWKPQENFSDYLKRCDILSYAVHEGSIVGFTAVSMMFFRNICLYSNDETMVLREFRNRKIALNLVILPLEWVFVKTRRFEGTTHIVFTSISANPRVVNFYFKNSWTRVFFDCSFKPSLPLIALKNEYCRKHKISLVHEDYPFCLKNLFPGSNTFSKDDPRFQFSREVKTNMPPEFNHMERGDAFAFMVKLPTGMGRMVVRVLMARCFGRDYLASREIGPFGARGRAARPRPSGLGEKPVAMVTRMGIVSSQGNSTQAESLPRASPSNGAGAAKETER